MTVIKEIAAERKRQIEVEGWTPEHDDTHTRNEMGLAALSYIRHAITPSMFRRAWPKEWPWEVSWWKPTVPRRDLVKAAALLVAEIERIDRAEAATTKGGD